MKKLLTGLSAFLLFSPLHVFAADGALSDTALGTTLPLWSKCCITPHRNPAFELDWNNRSKYAHDPPDHKSK